MRRLDAPWHVLTVLAVEDLERAVAFYGAAFGWASAVQTPVYHEFSLPRGMRLGLYRRDGFARNTGLPPTIPALGSTTATELYFGVNDLESPTEQLLAAGARLLSPPALRPWGEECAYFSDPDGNVLVLAAAPRSEPAA